MDFEQLAQRWIAYYAQLPGRRIKVTTEQNPAPELLWVLGQEQNFLVASKEPFTGDPETRSYHIIDVRTIQSVELLPEIDPGAEKAPHESAAQLDTGKMLCGLGRVTIHAMTPSGARSHLEINGLEPRYGGFFVSANHVLGFALHHLHKELQIRELIGLGDLPLKENFWEVPVKSVTAPLPLAARPNGTLAVYILETRGDQLAGVAVAALGENPPKALSTQDRVTTWGYELLCEEAKNRRLLPGDFTPRVRRAQLH